MKKKTWLERFKDFMNRPLVEKKPDGTVAVNILPEEPSGNVLSRLDARPLKGPDIVIPEGVTELWHGAFEGRPEIVSITVPGTVKVIGGRAFAECENLETVTLAEGVEVIEACAFTGCGKLTRLTVPDSVKDMGGWAFYRSGVKEPVFNASRDTLFYCPPEVGERYSVPNGVKRIANRAFLELGDLKRVDLPRGLERIDDMAFLNCGLREISIPGSVQTFGDEVLRGCEELKEIILGGVEDPIRSMEMKFRLRGAPVLAPVCRVFPKNDRWQTRAWRRLTESCAMGDAEAMNALADFYEARYRKAPETDFFLGASNFWRYRAYLYGSEPARKWMLDWVEANPNRQLPSTLMTEALYGAGTGPRLRALGFPFFEGKEVYDLEGMDEEGVVEVTTYAGEEGPDEDGFGREECYNWWYLDDHLCLPKGGACLRNFSCIDKRVNKERFREQHDRAARVMYLRRGLLHERRGELEAAYERYLKAGEAGDALALRQIGNLYLHKKFRGKPAFLGSGSVMPWELEKLEPDLEAAYGWFLKAAEAGDTGAMSNVGVMLATGQGCEKNPDEGRVWLEKAADEGVSMALKALKDLYQIDRVRPIKDAAYDAKLDEFCRLAEAGGVAWLRARYDWLLLGNEGQLSRLGYRLAEGRYNRSDGYRAYAVPSLNAQRSGMPISHFRCGWGTAVIVNLRAFLDRSPILSFASGITQEICPVWGIKKLPGSVQYDASEFGWLNGRRKAWLLQAEPGLKGDEHLEALKYCGIDVPALLEALKPTEDEAVFIENGEKEFSVEIGHVIDGDVRVLLRYTIDSLDQGDSLAKVSHVAFKKEPPCQ